MKILKFSLALATVVLASAILLSTSFVKADRDRDDDAHKEISQRRQVCLSRQRR